MQCCRLLLGLLAGGAYNNDNNSGLWLSNANDGSNNYNDNVGSRKLIRNIIKYINIYLHIIFLSTC